MVDAKSVDIVGHRLVRSSLGEFVTVLGYAGRSSDCADIELSDSEDKIEAVVSRAIDSTPDPKEDGLSHVETAARIVSTSLNSSRNSSRPLRLESLTLTLESSSCDRGPR